MSKVQSYTHAYFEAGQTYKAWIRSDDGYQLLAKHHTTGDWEYFTPQNEWKHDAYASHKEIEFEVSNTGWYDFHFHHYEGGGDTYIDLSWEIPWTNPLPGYAVTSEIGEDRHYNGREWKHKGIDLGTGNNTPPISAPKSGIIKFAGWDNSGYGNLIKIEHDDGFETLYAHLSSLNVNAGQYVSAGTHIGNVGTTGNSTGNHLHFEVRKDGVPQNPRNYIQF